MSDDFQVSGRNATALFTLRIHRGDGMVLLAMNWKKGRPPNDFVGFAIEYREPQGSKFYALKNRLTFPLADGAIDPNAKSTLRAPIQKFRWVHFPRNAELAGEFTYRVTPVFMNAADELSYGESQTAALELRRDTYPGKLNIAFTRGFVSSQAFVDRFQQHGPISKLLPAKADKGLTFVPTHVDSATALAWMGFEARSAILEVLDQAIADKKAEVRVVAYDLNEPEVVARLEKLGKRLKVLIDDSAHHADANSPESKAAKRLEKSAGEANVRRQHMGGLQHNKTIVVHGPKTKAAVCGSTNFTWRGLYVQSNHAVVVRGKKATKPFRDAFDAYWANSTASGFGGAAPAGWTKLDLGSIDARVTFSPHDATNAQLDAVAADVGKAKSSLLYSLAFLHQTPGPMRDAIKALTKNAKRFVYGVSDRKTKDGLDVQVPGGNVSPVYAAALTGSKVPEPFKSEPTGGAGNRMHHKFVVVDFDKPSARVWFGSYNFSSAADRKNGENLLLIRDRRVAVSFMIEALRIFDHYHFRVTQAESKKARKKLFLARPPRKSGENPWWLEHWTDPRKVRDRKLFAK
ncbi:MAG: phospholipase [Planctomycetes bacterium]|nr:phospholipase [Planctomycetota bacterium]